MTARILYHFKMSPFSRRARLALSHKGLASSTELRDARVEPSHMDDVRRLSPLATVPVLVDGAHTIVDSTAIFHYLDAAYPDAPALLPKELDRLARALETIALIDASVNPVVDLGSRYFALATSPAWDATLAERRVRIAGALERLVVLSSSLGRDGAWGAAEISLVSAVLWFAGLPARLGQNPAIERILGLGVQMPDALVAWAEPFRTRDDVQAL